MGIIQLWHEDVRTTFSNFGFSLNLLESETDLVIMSFEGANLLLHVVSIRQCADPAQFIALQEKFMAQGTVLVHLWEDVWQCRRAQVIGRILSMLGKNKRIHGRKSHIVKVGQQLADEFWEQHHLQGTAKAKYRLALYIGDKPVAIAGFSNLRYMKKGGPEYRSAELIRFASCTGYTVIGGFTKLLKYFIRQYRPDDVMSYADRDWSIGNAYQNAGFVLTETTPPAEILLDTVTFQRYFTHRFPGNPADENSYARIFNSGNLKYILYLRPDPNHD